MPGWRLSCGPVEGSSLAHLFEREASMRPGRELPRPCNPNDVRLEAPRRPKSAGPQPAPRRSTRNGGYC